MPLIISSIIGFAALIGIAYPIPIDVSNIVEETLPSVVAVNTIIYNEINTGINIFGKSIYGGDTITQETDACGTGIIIGKSEENLLILTNNQS